MYVIVITIVLVSMYYDVSPHMYYYFSIYIDKVSLMLVHTQACIILVSMIASTFV